MSDKIKKCKTKYGISFNEDSLKVIQNMPDEYVDMILTDPPYGINYKSNGRKDKTRFKHIQNDNNDFRFKIYDEFDRVMKQNSICAVFCSWKNYAEDYIYLSKYFKVVNVVIWHKPGGGIGDLKHTLATDYEMCIICAKGNVELQGKRNGSVITVKKVPSTRMMHPTEKPVDLYRFIIQTWTKKGQIVFDPFAGSFVNAIACIRSGRKYICSEIEGSYFEQGQRRIIDEIETM